MITVTHIYTSSVSMTRPCLVACGLSRCSLFTAASRMILITPSALFHQFRWGGNDLISMGRPLDGAPIDTS